MNILVSLWECSAGPVTYQATRRWRVRVCVVCIPSPTAAVGLAGSRRHFHKAILRTKRVDHVSSDGWQLVRCRQKLKLCVVCTLF